MTAEPTPKVKSLYKALHLLDYFDQDHPDAGVTELAEYSGLLKSSVHNILQTFELCGYVTQSSETSRYMLGGAAVSLFSRFKATRKIDYRITEYLQSLRDMFHKNVYFAAKEQDAAVYLCAEQSFNHTGSPLSKEGAHAPLHATSLGKVLLGYSTAHGLHAADHHRPGRPPRRARTRHLRRLRHLRRGISGRHLLHRRARHRRLRARALRHRHRLRQPHLALPAQAVPLRAPLRREEGREHRLGEMVTAARVKRKRQTARRPLTAAHLRTYCFI